MAGCFVLICQHPPHPPAWSHHQRECGQAYRSALRAAYWTWVGKRTRPPAVLKIYGVEAQASNAACQIACLCGLTAVENHAIAVTFDDFLNHRAEYLS